MWHTHIFFSVLVSWLCVWGVCVRVGGVCNSLSCGAMDGHFHCVGHFNCTYYMEFVRRVATNACEEVVSGINTVLFSKAKKKKDASCLLSFLLRECLIIKDNLQILVVALLHTRWYVGEKMTHTT